jgi:hypothetical protein
MRTGALIEQGKRNRKCVQAGFQDEGTPSIRLGMRAQSQWGSAVVSYDKT